MSRISKPPKIEVGFCRLDARDDPYTGYSPAGFYDAANDKPLEYLTQEQGQLAILLEREYLTKVAALQDELQAKYEQLLSELKTATPPADEAWDSALSKEDYEKVRAYAEAQFPGREAEYYT